MLDYGKLFITAARFVSRIHATYLLVANESTIHHSTIRPFAILSSVVERCVLYYQATFMLELQPEWRSIIMI